MRVITWFRDVNLDVEVRSPRTIPSARVNPHFNASDFRSLLQINAQRRIFLSGHSVKPTPVGTASEADSKISIIRNDVGKELHCNLTRWAIGHAMFLKTSASVIILSEGKIAGIRPFHLLLA